MLLTRLLVVIFIYIFLETNRLWKSLLPLELQPLAIDSPTGSRMLSV